MVAVGRLRGDGRATVVLIQLFLLVYATASLLIVGARTDWFHLIRRLQAQKEALRQGIVTAHAGIVILERSVDGVHVIADNPRAQQILGADLPPYGIPDLDAVIATTANGRVEFERDDHVFEAVVSDSASLGGANLVSIVIINVTEREERERQARELSDELRRLNDQKDDFISAVSHELRTPVTSIIGFSENLVDERLPSDLAESGTIIARNARRLADVIEDVLELSRLSALGGPLPPPAEVDVVSLTRADDGGAIVRVVDRGLGIPSEYRELVWQRFARAPIDSHRQVPGTGLGLPIVKALLESRLGGTARLLETPGGGTTVEVRLPAVAPAVSSPHTVA